MTDKTQALLPVTPELLAMAREIAANHIGWDTYEDAAAHNHHTEDFVQVALAAIYETHRRAHSHLDREAAKEVAIRISEEMFSHPDDQLERDIAYGAAFAGIVEATRNLGDVGMRSAFPESIGRLMLGEKLSSDHYCGGGHEMPNGHPIYWQQRGGEYPDDIEGYCLACAITNAESEAGWCECSTRADLTPSATMEGVMRAAAISSSEHRYDASALSGDAGETLYMRGYLKVPCEVEPEGERLEALKAAAMLLAPYSGDPSGTPTRDGLVYLNAAVNPSAAKYFADLAALPSHQGAE